MPPDFGGYMTAAAAAAVSAGYGNGSAYSPSQSSSAALQYPAYKRPAGAAGATHPYQVELETNSDYLRAQRTKMDILQLQKYETKRFECLRHSNWTI